MSDTRRLLDGATIHSPIMDATVRLVDAALINAADYANWLRCEIGAPEEDRLNQLEEDSHRRLIEAAEEFQRLAAFVTEESP